MNAYTVRIANWHTERELIRSVRETVFICEQRVPVELEWDDLDVSCIHFIGAGPAKRPIATARLLPPGAHNAHGTVGRMAVLKEWRGKGVGGALLRRIIEEAMKREIQQLALSAQTHAVGFYARFGFRAAGNTYMDAGLPHIGMILPLSDRPR